MTDLERIERLLEQILVWAATGEDSDAVSPEVIGKALKLIDAHLKEDAEAWRGAMEIPR